MSWQALILMVGRALWLSTPFLIVLALVLLTMAPTNMFGRAIPPPDFAIIAVFFWAVYAPHLFPPAAVFALGLAQDLLGAGPIGFWALTLLLIYGLSLSQRVFFIGRTVIGVWLGFAVVAFLAALIAWALSSVYHGAIVDPGNLFARAAISALVFPIAGRFFLFWRRTLTTAPEKL
jgi:rod shape-determining protein MreD